MMSKNVIDKKAILIQDQLYDELLNGFNSEYINKGAKDSKEYRFSSVYIKRLNLVSNSFFGSEYCKKFLSENYDFIFDEFNKNRDAILNRYLILLKTPQDDEEEEIDVKESDFGLFKIIDVLNSISNMINFFEASKDLVQKYKNAKVTLKKGNREQQMKLYNQIADELKTRSKLLIDSILQPTVESVLKLYESDKIEKMWEGMKTAIVGNATESAIWGIVGWVATKLTAGVGGLIVGGARAAVVAARIKSIIKEAKKLYKMSELLYKGIKFSFVIEDIIDWTKEDEEKWEKWINKNITPKLEPYRHVAHAKISDITSKTGMLDKVNEFKGNVNELFVDINKLSEENEENEENEQPKSQQFSDGYNFQSMIIPLPKGDFKVDIDYTYENLDNVLEDTYKIKLSKSALETIQQHPAIQSMKTINNLLQNVVQVVMKNNLYIIEKSFPNFSHTAKITEIQKQYDAILSDVQNKIDEVFEKKANDLQKQKLSQTDPSKKYEHKLQLLSEGKSEKETMKPTMWVLDNATEEQFRPLFPTKYGYLGGVYLSAKSGSFIPNEIYFHNGNRNEYDVLYYNEKGKVGYKGFNIIGQEYERRGESGGFVPVDSNEVTHGYTSMMENLFMYGAIRKEEAEVEESIFKNVNKIYNILTERIIA